MMVVMRLCQRQDVFRIVSAALLGKRCQAHRPKPSRNLHSNRKITVLHMARADSGARRRNHWFLLGIHNQHTSRFNTRQRQCNGDHRYDILPKEQTAVSRSELYQRRALYAGSYFYFYPCRAREGIFNGPLTFPFSVRRCGVIDPCLTGATRRPATRAVPNRASPKPNSSAWQRSEPSPNTIIQHEMQEQKKQYHPKDK